MSPSMCSLSLSRLAVVVCAAAASALRLAQSRRAHTAMRSWPPLLRLLPERYCLRCR